ncbi:MAG: hypothetical protein ACOCZK_05645 [Planctomycetota bacterium]
MDQPPRRENERYYMSLQPSEMAVFRAASEIFAAYVASGQVGDEHARKQYMRQSISDAISLATHVEKLIQSDNETAHGA